MISTRGGFLLPPVGQRAERLSSASDTQQLSRVYDILTAGEALQPVPRYYLIGPVEDDPVELPEEVYPVLRHVLEAMRKGLSVTISPTSQTLTTQQAVDLLGISRPTLIKALDGGTLPYTRSGSHRWLTLTDVLDYREVRRQEQYTATNVRCRPRHQRALAQPATGLPALAGRRG